MKRLYAAMPELDIIVKLIWPFDIKRGFRQGNSLSSEFLNWLLEKIIAASELNDEGTIFYKNVQLLV